MALTPRRVDNNLRDSYAAGVFPTDVSGTTTDLQAVVLTNSSGIELGTAAAPTAVKLYDANGNPIETMPAGASSRNALETLNSVGLIPIITANIDTGSTTTVINVEADITASVARGDYVYYQPTSAFAFAGNGHWGILESATATQLTLSHALPVTPSASGMVRVFRRAGLPITVDGSSNGYHLNVQGFFGINASSFYDGLLEDPVYYGLGILANRGGFYRAVDSAIAAPGSSDEGLVVRQVGMPAAAALADNTANPTLTQIGAFNMLYDGSTWDRAPGTAADGALVNLGSNNDVTVTSGSITANAGTNLNTSALALESGGNLAAVAASASVLDDWDESDRAKVNPIAGQAGIDGGAGSASAKTTRVVIATDQGGLVVNATYYASLTNTGTTSLSTARKFYGLKCGNGSTTTQAFVRAHDTSSPATSSDTPMAGGKVPLGPLAGWSDKIDRMTYVAVVNGISLRATTGVADSNTASPSANDVFCTVYWDT